MQLYINDEMVDVQFEGEKTLIDVYRSIETEAVQHSRYILELRVDEREVSGDFLEQTSLDGVQSMHFWIGDSQAVLLRTARTIDRYLDQIGSALFYTEELQPEDLKELHTGITWVKEFVESAANLLGLDLQTYTVPLPDKSTSAAMSDVIQALESESAAMQTGESEATPDSLLQHLRAIKSFTTRLIVRLHADSLSGSDILTGLDRFEQELPGLSERIVSINEAYQSGRDDQGVAELDAVMNELDGHMPYLFAALERLPEPQRQVTVSDSDEKSLEESAASLLALLGDLSSALEESDIVAAGDILEYELADQIQRLSPLLQRLKKFLPGDVAEKQS